VGKKINHLWVTRDHFLIESNEEPIPEVPQNIGESNGGIRNKILNELLAS
jgi:hypothetical protein